MTNAAVVFYKRCRAVARHRSDFVLDDIRKYAMRSLRLTDEERRAVLLDLALLMKGEVACPTCGATGPHRSNAHHRVASIRFTCARCAAVFSSTEV